uniref:Dynein light chain n=1 Tax=Angiostrongylus cantonensis TaxID=6313 RepID=A0A0K0DDA6_ANGCA
MVLNGFIGRASTTPSSSSNSSIDRVVFQVEMLSSQINVLTYKVDDAVAVVKERAQQTIASLTHSFNNGTIENVKRMLALMLVATSFDVGNGRAHVGSAGFRIHDAASGTASTHLVDATMFVLSFVEPADHID